MLDLFQNRYRVSSARLSGYDYSRAGYYFVTICTKDRENYFGKIRYDQMFLNKIGKTVENYWLEIPRHFPFVGLDEFIIMPNHIHGILVIIVETPKLGVSTTLPNLDETPRLGVSTMKWKPGTLGVIINQFKRKCTIEMGKLAENSIWQPRFYDHVVRNEQSLFRIREYIKNNPKNWKIDRNYCGN